MKIIVPISILVAIIDQFVKYVIINNFSYGKSHEIINDFFSLTLLKNKGAAFSILSSNTYLIIFISIIALIVIYQFFIKNTELTKADIVLYSMLIGGIIGNLIDRMLNGYVIDYLDFKIFGFNYPVFNFADIMITTSIILIIIKTVKGEKHEVSGR